MLFKQVTSESLHSIAALNELETLVMVGCGLVDDTGLYSIAKGCPSLKVSLISVPHIALYQAYLLASDTFFYFSRSKILAI